MVMPRAIISRRANFAHNQLPAAGVGFWYPLHGGYATGIEGAPDLVRVVQAGAASGSEWTARLGGYTYPADNGNTNQVYLRAVDDDDDRYLDTVLALYQQPVGTQILIASELSYVDQNDSTGTIFQYGRFTTVSQYLLQCSTSDALMFVARAVGASGAVTNSLTTLTGVAFSAFKAQGVFSCVCDITISAPLTLDVIVRFGNAAVGSGSAAGTLDMSALGATALPGWWTSTASDFGGLKLGAREGSPGVCDNFWGRGVSPSNTGWIGNFGGRKWPGYSATRAADTLASMLARPRDIPATFLGA